ncbi:small proline-rich protein 2E-like isoform X1 [Equus asinus]|uniref:small proline-rich protein 2E-like isoform X1 n=2 Tax=Equus asinus TaxID=9793 RepID=UPI0038F5F559
MDLHFVWEIPGQASFWQLHFALGWASSPIKRCSAARLSSSWYSSPDLLWRTCSEDSRKMSSQQQQCKQPCQPPPVCPPKCPEPCPPPKCPELYPPPKCQQKCPPVQPPPPCQQKCPPKSK